MPLGAERPSLSNRSGLRGAERRRPRSGWERAGRCRGAGGPAGSSGRGREPGSVGTPTPSAPSSAGASPAPREGVPGFDLSEGDCVPPVLPSGSIGRGPPAWLLQISCSPRFTLHWDHIHPLIN